MRPIPLALLLLLLAGCTTKDTLVTGSAVSTVAPENPKLLVVTGPGGDVAIGDPVEKAKKAFPMPKGAVEINQPMSLMNIGEGGWGWTPSVGSPDITEVATKDGKVVAISGPTEVPKDFDAAAKEVVAKLGKPHSEAQNKSALLYVWVSGEYSHFYLQIRKDLKIFGYGAGHVVAPKGKLKMLLFDEENPKMFTDAVGGLTEGMLSGPK